MWPPAFVFLERLPLNANDKVDRQALPAPERGAGGGEREVVAPRDDLERRLVALWEELLARRPIGVRDDFFAAGGHSLLAVRLMAHIQARFGRSLPIATLLRHPTVERLAALLRTAPVVGAATAARRSALVDLTAARGAQAPRRPLFCV